jgi:hypothetical protein
MANHFKNSHFLFWQKWLFYSSLIFALGGIVFALFEKNLLFLPYDKMVANALWHSSEFPPEAETFRAFIYLPFGGTIACAYILLAYIVWYPFKENPLVLGVFLFFNLYKPYTKHFQLACLDVILVFVWSCCGTQ